jgi:rubrerythrin
MEIRKIFEYALQREFEGKRFFEENAQRLNHAAAAGAFRRLAAEEQMHIVFIQDHLETLDKGTAADMAPATPAAGAALPGRGIFSQRAEAELLDQTVVEAMVPDLPVLRTAYLIERDFAEFYEMAAARTEGDAQEALKMLAYWERRHEALFKKLHDRAFEEYAQMPWGG